MSHIGYKMVFCEFKILNLWSTIYWNKMNQKRLLYWQVWQAVWKMSWYCCWSWRSAKNHIWKFLLASRGKIKFWNISRHHRLLSNFISEPSFKNCKSLKFIQSKAISLNSQIFFYSNRQIMKNEFAWKI